jgi:hypothetical protein
MHLMIFCWRVIDDCFEQFLTISWQEHVSFQRDHDHMSSLYLNNTLGWISESESE